MLSRNVHSTNIGQGKSVLVLESDPHLAPHASRGIAAVCVVLVVRPQKNSEPTHNLTAVHSSIHYSSELNGVLLYLTQTGVFRVVLRVISPHAISTTVSSSG